MKEPLLCKLGFHNWEPAGFPSDRHPLALISDQRLIYQCTRCGKHQMVCLSW